MSPSLDYEIREKLASYLVGDISLEDFEDWFVSASWNVNQSKNQIAINMVYEIELWLAEYSDGFRREDELKALLWPLVENYVVESENSSGLQFSSSAQVSWWSISPVTFRILNS